MTWAARIMMPFMGFKATLIVGPIWLKLMTPAGGSLRADFDRILGFEFDKMIGAHGGPWRSGAREKARTAVENAFAK